jgi:hypothetical protein
MYCGIKTSCFQLKALNLNRQADRYATRYLRSSARSFRPAAQHAIK